MAPPVMGQTGNEESMAKESLAKAKKLIGDLEKKGCEVPEAKGWCSQADEMFRGGLFRTSLIYAGYALNAAEDVLGRIKTMILRIGRVKTRAIEMLGKGSKYMPKVEEMVEGMKLAITEGRLDDCQELVNEADNLMMGSSSPYLATESVGMTTVAPSRGYSSCPSCGNIVEASWTQCQYCDASLSQEDEAPVTSGPAWTSTDTGPVRYSSSETEGPAYWSEKEEEEDGTPEVTEGPGTTGPDTDLSKDLEDMERIEKDMAKVEEDLEKEAAEEETPPKEEAAEGKKATSIINIPPLPPPLPTPARKEGPDEEKEGAEEKKGSDEERPDEATSTPSGTEAPPTCPGCGEDIEPEWVKCPVCKHRLE